MIPLTVPEVSRLIAATVRTACGVVVRIAGAWTAMSAVCRSMTTPRWSATCGRP